jgi:hypothetical protein
MPRVIILTFNHSATEIFEGSQARLIANTRYGRERQLNPKKVLLHSQEPLKAKSMRTTNREKRTRFTISDHGEVYPSER